MEQAPSFIEEIEFDELQFGEIVGRGAFGVVSRASWRGIDVAVKHIETESEKKAFKTELTQLSRVSHPNIVKLYGACTSQPVCLVMEYAEGGSLYNVLHGEGPQPSYIAAHAMSWTLQCAQGVAYLHGMKPKPLIHRDLKPPNLLLIAGGTILKICDFGTACDAHTHMTNNKGSAAWMAPEVFEGSNYSEKCDVFSWGIILWEVITRRKPFDEIGGPAFRIMWAVHNGKRPPLIQGLPKPLEVLMTRCWSSNPVERPSMAEVARIMLHLFKFFKGAEIPLRYPTIDEAEGYYETESPVETPPTTNQSQDSGHLTGESRGSTIRDTVRQALLGDAVPIKPTPPRTKPVVIEEGDHRRTSAPASLAASRESLLDKSSRSSTPIEAIKRYSADLSRLGEVDLVAQGAQIAPNQQPFVRGHRRTGSHDMPVIVTSGAGGTSPVWSNKREVRGHRRSGSYGNSPIVTSAQDIKVSTSVTSSPAKSIHRSVTEPTPLDGNANSSWEPGAPIDMSVLNLGVLGMNNSAACLDLQALDHQLQPLAPCPTSQESMGIFQQHLQLAQKYIRVLAEVRLLEERKHQLIQEAEQDVENKHSQPRLVEEYQRLMTENDQLLLLQRNLKKQAEVIRKQQARRTGNT